MRKSLYLVDIFSFIFRAYYAIRPLSAPDGTPVNAVYGVITMLKKLIDAKRPDHLVVCMESKLKKTFREELYPEYKANRGAPPEDLSPQIPLVEEFVQTYPIKVLTAPGYEADDIIATLVEKFSGRDDIDVYIVTSDKDLMQLVGENVFIYDTMKEKVFGREAVIEKFGVPPEKVIDVQSLSGDPSDNIPGVNGVGPKTAAKLVNEYGDLEAVLAHASEIKGKLGERLAVSRDDALLSRQLVTLDKDIPIDLDWRDLELGAPDTENLAAFYRKLGFRSLADATTHTAKTVSVSPELTPQTQAQTTSRATPPEKARFSAITTIADLERILAPLRHSKQPIAIDTETDSIDALRANLVGISFCFTPEDAYYVPIAHKDGPNLSLSDVATILGPLLADSDLPKIAQNAKYDLHVLRRHGLPVTALKDDTLIASYLIDPEGAHDLDTLASKYLDHRMVAFGDVVKKGQNFSDVGLEDAVRYAAEDAWAAYSLAAIFSKELPERGALAVYRDFEIPLISVLTEMENAGILVDLKLLSDLDVEFRARLSVLEEQIQSAAGTEFNVSSPKQLADVLFNKLGLPVIKKTKTGYSTDVDVLTELAKRHDVPRLMLEHRSVSKLLSTYVEQLANLADPATGRVHTHFNQAVVATGRLSSTDPNLQNIPIKTAEGRRIREVFIAPPHCSLVSADYSQVELRLLAAFSRDPNLVQAFRDGVDIHRTTAAKVFGLNVGDVTSAQRNIGKTINFGVIYGQSAFGLAQMLEIPQNEAKHFISKFYAQFANVRDYRESVLERARSEGYVSTYSGRRRYLPDLNSRNQLARANAERAAFNAIFQGSAADLIKKAMLDISAIFKQRQLKSRLLLQVHDELVFETPDNELSEVTRLVPQLMSAAFALEVPLDVTCKSGRNWGEAH